MTNSEQSPEAVRDAILQLLSAHELAGIGSSATKARLANGDEYLDLQQLHLGVQRVRGSARPEGDLVIRKVIYEDTWRRVLRQLTRGSH